MSSTLRKRRRRYTETGDFLRLVARLVGRAGERVGEADAEDLVALLALRDELDKAIVQAVGGLRESGATWEQIGAAAGTTRQAALMRWGPKLEQD